MVTLNIHWETFDEKSFAQIERLAIRGPIAISISPWQIPKMQDHQISKVKEILSRQGYVLGQQGLNHKCKKCSDFHKIKEEGNIIKAGVDPWHENYCLWFGPISAREQEDFMREGRIKLNKVFGKNPELYVPPNNYFDLTTVKIASKLGYKWLTDKAMIPLNSFILERIIIVPEADPEILKNKQFYIHADRWDGDLNKVIKLGLTSFYDINLSKNSKERLEENIKLKYTGKIARDLHKGYNISEENAKQLTELLYASKFGKDNFL